MIKLQFLELHRFFFNANILMSELHCVQQGMTKLCVTQSTADKSMSPGDQN